MVIKAPRTVLELESISIVSSEGLVSYSNQCAREIWERCDKKTGEIDLTLRGKNISGIVKYVIFAPARIGGSSRMLSFEYAREFDLVGEGRITEERKYYRVCVDVSRH